MQQIWCRLEASRFEILLTIVSLAIALLAAEWLCRLFVFDPTAAYIRTPGWSMAVHHNDLIPRVHEDHTININNLGIRGELPSSLSSPRIAVFGGSTVEDWVLPERQTWVQQLGENLRRCAPQVWAGNFGKAGVNARHHLIQFPEVVKYTPRIDMFVVLLGLNDFLFDLHIHHSLVTAEGWWRQQALMYDHGDEGHSALLGIGRRLYRKWSRPATEPIPVSDFGNFMKMLRDTYAKVTDQQWVRELPDLSSHLDTYRQTISRLKELADAYGAPIVFVTQPYVWSDTMSEDTRQQVYAGFIGSDLQSPETKWYTSEALRVGLSAYNATLLDKCRADRLSCVDAAHLFESHEDYFFDDFHFSPEGAAALGAFVGEDIKKRLPGCAQN
jgi:lysophospholipase L1-like esterase